MKKSYFSVVIVFVATLTLLLSGEVQAITTRIVSNTTWKVFDKSGNDLGYAQNVCLNASAPTNCPTGATVYGYAFSGWSVNLSSISGATWIWAPNITGATLQPNNAEFTFQNQYFLCCDAQSGTVSIAADNFAEVFIDGVSVTTSSSPNTLSTFNIPSTFLSRGQHIIKIKVKNDDQSPCNQYQCNPAGLVFGATILEALHELPKCTDAGGKKYDAGYNDQVDCIVDGKVSKKSRLCACLTCTYADWLYGDCTPPPCQLTIAAVPLACAPATNTYSLEVTVNYSNAPSGDILVNGQNFTPNGIRSSTFTLTRLPANGAVGLSVNAVFAANASCPASTTYNAPTNCTPPPTCLGKDGRTYKVGESETFNCRCDVSQSRTCQPDGSWGILTECILPLVKEGDWSGDRVQGDCRTCPPGTTSKPRRTTVCEGWWIFRRCETIETTDHFCLRD